jgi:tetratricopeptide (TPR) repeat protein
MNDGVRPRPESRRQHFEVLFLHPAGSGDPQRVSLAIGLLEWIRLWFENRDVRAMLWPETAVDPEGHRRFIMRPTGWEWENVRRKLALAPTAEGAVYLNLNEDSDVPIARLRLMDRRGDRLADVSIPMSNEGIYEQTSGAISVLLKALDRTFPDKPPAELFQTHDHATAIASLYAIERTVAFGAGVGSDEPGRILLPVLHCLERESAHPIARECLTRLATALIETGRADAQSAAIDALERWCRIAPLTASPPFHLALARQRVGKTEEARAAYEDSLRRDPAFIPALQGYADLLAGRGFVDQGLAVLQQALGGSGVNGNLLDQAGCLLANAGRLPEAEPFFRRAIAAAGPPTANANLARCLMASGREDEALGTVTAGLAGGMDLSLLEVLGEICRRPGFAAARAKAVLRGRVAEGNPEEAIQRLLVDLALEMDGPASAATHARRLIQIASIGDNRRFGFNVVLRAKVPDFEEKWAAAVQEVTGKNPAASESFLREIVDAEPEFGRAHFLLGVALERLGRLHEAAPHLEQAALYESDDPVILDLLARARADAGDLPGAAQVHHRAAILAPKDPRILRNAAVSLLRAGFIDEGITTAGVSLGIQPDQADLINLVRQLTDTSVKGAKGPSWRDRGRRWLERGRRSLRRKR